MNFTWVCKLERLCEGYYSEKAGRLADRLDVRTERESDPNFPPATSFRVGAKHSQMRAAIFIFTFQRHKLFCNSLGCEKNQVSVLPCEPQHSHAYLEAEISLNFHGSTSKPWHTPPALRGLMLSLKFFQEKQNSALSPTIRKPAQPH